MSWRATYDAPSRIAISRGRVSVRVNLEHTGNRSAELAFDEELARQYIEAAKTLSALGEIETRLTAADLFRAPGLFRLEDSEAMPVISAKLFSKPWTTV